MHPCGTPPHIWGRSTALAGRRAAVLESGVEGLTGQNGPHLKQRDMRPLEDGMTRVWVTCQTRLLLKEDPPPPGVWGGGQRPKITSKRGC